MLRLAHRILSQHVFMTAVRDQPVPEDKKNLIVECLSAIRGGLPIIIADNVSEYLESFRGESEVMPSNMFNHVSPPFAVFFIEWISPPQQQLISEQQGWLVYSESLSEYAEELAGVFVDGRELITRLFMVGFWSKGGVPYSNGDYAEILLSRQGEPRHIRGTRANPPVHVPLAAMSFMGCKNVVRTDATETEGPPAKWLRRMKQPTLRYHVLEINPMKEVLRKEGGSETNGLKKALHICRGHFATYTEEKPLFGRIAGTVFRPAHVRGSKEFGEVKKDYAVNPPKGSQ